MGLKIRKITALSPEFPEVLKHIPDPPKQLYVLGNSLAALLERPRLAVVGSRKVSPYGLHVTNLLVKELAEQGMVIVSGLALGLDGAAHKAALQAGGVAIAVLAGGLDHIHPSTHRQLAVDILRGGGVLISEYAEGVEPLRHHFIARNRLISGLSDGVLIPEAAAKSGSLHTAGFALEQGRPVMAVPGNITSPNSGGTNNLIKTGATPVHSAQDVLEAMGLEQITKQPREVIGSNAEEQAILQLLSRGITDVDELCALSKLEAALFNQTLTMLEIAGKIRPLGAGHWVLK